MTRDEARARVVTLLGVATLDLPHLRLGQFLLNAVDDGLYYLTDEELAAKLDAYLEEHVGK